MKGLIRALTTLLFQDCPTNPFDEDGDGGSPSANGSKTTVLAIDDDPVFLEGLRGLLQESGFTVLTSTTGPKGLDMLRYAQRDIGAVLLDYNMPKFNGAETLEYVRKLSPQAKVIALTGVDLNQLPASFRQGVDEFIRKPCRSAHLVEVLNALIGNGVAVPAHSQN